MLFNREWELAGGEKNIERTPLDLGNSGEK